MCSQSTILTTDFIVSWLPGNSITIYSVSLLLFSGASISCFLFPFKLVTASYYSEKIGVISREIIILPFIKSSNLGTFVHIFFYFSSCFIHLIQSKYLLNGYYILGNVINSEDNKVPSLLVTTFLGKSQTINQWTLIKYNIRHKVCYERKQNRLKA